MVGTFQEVEIARVVIVVCYHHFEQEAARERFAAGNICVGVTKLETKRISTLRP